MPHRHCAKILRSFYEAAGAELRAIDPKALITAGLLGGGQCGTGGDDYQHVSESPYVDVVHYHDYGAGGVTLPGDQWNGLARRIDQAEAAGKPLLVAEIGEWAGSCESLEDRASHIADKIEGQKSAGTTGVSLWAFVPDPRPLECTMDIGESDHCMELSRLKPNGADGLNPALPEGLGRRRSQDFWQLIEELYSFLLAVDSV